MTKIRIVTDPYTCEKLWKTYIPVRSVSDLWDFRNCFQEHYKNSLRFLVAEQQNKISGVLPLALIRDLEINAFFPAETWRNKTWLERTPIYKKNSDTLDFMLSYCSERTYLRYMDGGQEYTTELLDIDETGYV